MQDGTYKRTENVIAKHPGQMRNCQDLWIG